MTAELDDALAAWRASRSVADAERVDAQALIAIAGWTPPVGRNAKQFHEAWLAEIASAAHRGWAADALTVKLPALPSKDFLREYDQRYANALVVRLDALAATAPDPRVARAIARLIVRWPHPLQFEHTRAAVVRAIAPSLDARTIAELRTQLAGTSRAEQRALIEKILEGAPAETAAAAAAPDDLSALWAETRASPDDDAPRHVLADALLRRGDPRGELLALQLAGDGQGDPARVAALVRAHGHAWLGPLARMAVRAQFVRGCVGRLELAGSAALSDAGWAQAAEEPALGTIEDLLPGDANAKIYARMLASPRLGALRGIEVFDRTTYAALATLPPRLTRVAFRPMRGNPAKALREHLPALARHPLTALALPLDAFAVLADSALFAQLRLITVGGYAEEMFRLWPNAPPGATLASGRIELEPCSLATFRYDPRVTIRRDEDDRVVVRAHPMVALRLPLPAGVDRLEIVGAHADELGSIRLTKPAAVEVVSVPASKAIGALAVR